MNVDKKLTTAIVAVLVLSIIVPLNFLPTNAQTAASKKTYAFIGTMPNPIGQGQTLILHIGIPDALQKDGDGWTGITVTVTKPDNTTETIGPYKTDSTGSTGALYTPTTTGTYYFQTHFPAQWYNYTAYNYYTQTTVTSNTYYEASDSDKLAVTVQEEAIPFYPGQALPTEYWSRPINSQLREWYQIGGNWLVPTPILPTDNLYAPYNDGPETAHVLWTNPIGDTMGGLAGGVDQTGYGTGDAYEGKALGGIIIGGVLYYNKYDSNQPQQAVVAINLHTGEKLWEKTLLANGRISFGQVLRWSSMNYQGDFSYIYVVSGGGYTGLPEVWSAFEPLNGDWKFNMTNLPSGTNYYGPNGEILRYTINKAAGWIAQWNSTAAVVKDNTGMADSWGSQTSGKVINAATKGYDLNVTIPKNLPGSIQLANPLDKIVGQSINQTHVSLWAISLKPDQQGQVLYNKVWNAPTDWASGNLTISWAAGSLTDNIAVLWARETQQYYGFSLSTGDFLWGPSERQHYLSIFDLVTTINYGYIISTGCSGRVYCYNATTGQRLWNYTAEDPYTEFTIGNDWWIQQQFIADGKVYIGQVEHSGNQPLPRGAPFLCMDIATGKVVWKMDGGYRQTCWGGKAMIGDSIIALQDTYDQRFYAIGKGPSQTTVDAPATGIKLGDSLIIRGTVTDISPGTSKYETAARFPSGVPAISDASQSEWMKYVYMQFARPTNATGVDVSLDTVDPNGNYIHIGNTTTDSTGMFSYQWVPEIPGKYTVIATFPGSSAYYSSLSETAIAVDNTAATPTPSPQPQTSIADTYFVPAIAGIFVAIIALGILMVALLRKRP